jgi:hypothetical protein
MPRIPLAIAGSLLVAACGGDIVETQYLSPEEVGGSYRICSLAFTPDGGFLPAVDIRAAAMDLTPGDGLPEPYLRLSSTGTVYQLEYTPLGDFIRDGFDGSYETRRTAVMLPFPSPAQAMNKLLLPSPLELSFTESPRSLDISSFHASHFVPRAQYVAMTGMDPTNLPLSIRGALSGHFRVGGCP